MNIIISIEIKDDVDNREFNNVVNACFENIMQTIKYTSRRHHKITDKYFGKETTTEYSLTGDLK